MPNQYIYMPIRYKIKAQKVIKKGNQMELQQNQFWQTRARGTNDQEYQIYLACADDGNGGDISRNGEPLLTYEEWLAN